jgi:D-serine deaminase-like pyridoxal phosphate-dependent protein
MTVRLEALETPALLLDVDRLDANIARMESAVTRLGARVRLHVKTPKSIDVVRRALQDPRGPITASTLKEAETFIDHGVTDVLYAVGIAPNKLGHVAALRRRGADLKVILDGVEAAHALVAAQASFGVEMPCLIEIDSDGHRAGIPPGDVKLLEVAGVLRAGGVPLCGVMTHAGSSYQCRSAAELRAKAEAERRAVVDSAALLREAGHACPIVSVGSTPTALFAEDLTGVTEVRAGVHVFFDLVMVGLGVCASDDIAISVLTTVIGHQPDRNWLLTDGGWMAMSRDRGTARQPVDQGLGLVCGLDGGVIDLGAADGTGGQLVVSDASQEHGIVTRRDGGALDPARFPVGTLLRVLPNHACATAAQFGEYHVVRAGSTIVDAVWPRFGGW